MILADTVAAKCFAYMQWHGNRVWRIATGLEESESSRQATINSWTIKKTQRKWNDDFLESFVLCCIYYAVYRVCLFVHFAERTQNNVLICKLLP